MLKTRKISIELRGALLGIIGAFAGNLIMEIIFDIRYAAMNHENLLTTIVELFPLGFILGFIISFPFAVGGGVSLAKLIKIGLDKKRLSKNKIVLFGAFFGGVIGITVVIFAYMLVAFRGDQSIFLFRLIAVIILASFAGGFTTRFLTTEI